LQLSEIETSETSAYQDQDPITVGARDPALRSTQDGTSSAFYSLVQLA
jgi:hypothetical protein